MSVRGCGNGAGRGAADSGQGSFPRAVLLVVPVLIGFCGAGVWYRHNARGVDQGTNTVVNEARPPAACRSVESVTDTAAAERLARIRIAEAERKAELPAFELSAKAQGVHEFITAELTGVKGLLGAEIRTFEDYRRAGDDAKRMSRYIIATNFYSKALAFETVLNKLLERYRKVKATLVNVGELRKKVDESGASDILPARYQEAVSVSAEADALFNAGKFDEALKSSDSVRKIFENLIRDAAAEMERKRILAVKKDGKTKEELWKECLNLRIRVPDHESDEITESLLRMSRDGVGYRARFDDCRKAKWDDPRILCLLGDNVKRRHDGWMPNEELALVFYEKALEAGCTNGVKAIGEIKASLAVKPYFDALESGDPVRIKAYLNAHDPCIGMTNSCGHTLMYYAAWHGDAHILEYLASLGHGYDDKNSSGATPLFGACANSNGVKAVSCIEWLVSKGADVNARNPRAGKFDNPYPILGVRTLPALNYMLDKGADPKVRGDHGNTLLHKVMYSSSDIALVSKVVGMFDDVNIRNETGETPLHFAVSGVNGPVRGKIGLLLEKGADVGARVGSGYLKGYQPLHLAAYIYRSTVAEKRVSAEAAAALCSGGADVNACIPVGEGALFNGWTPLMLAAAECNVPVLEKLLDCGADVNIRSKGDEKGCMALHLVDGGDEGDVKIIDLLYAKGCKIDVPVVGNEYTEGHTLLHLLCKGVDYGMSTRKLMRRILAKNASVELLTTGGTYNNYTPLGLACKAANYSAVKVLLEADCDIRTPSQSDKEPIHIIADAGSRNASAPEIVICLAEYGADVNAPMAGARYSFQKGMTPLHILADSSLSSVAVLETLLKCGAEVDSRDSRGRTPLWKACNSFDVGKNAGKLKQIGIFLAHGADPSVRAENGKALADVVQDEKVRALLESAMGKKRRPGGAAKTGSERMVGTWVCRTEVRHVTERGKDNAHEITPFLPVSTIMELSCREDGTVEILERSGRTFGISSGTWRCRHGMLMMKLSTPDGFSYELNAMVRWNRDGGFELRYDNGEYSGLIRKRCEGLRNLNAVVSCYVNDELEVSVSVKQPGFSCVKAVCRPHVFGKKAK